ncbi:Zinc finger transcription factor-like protein [Hapsidospora chrysogenum ATCC 11550]|uniref:Zinc finger transcription factor-like protein n=1 Tax=Hapsidospora chrysogenum (strain ATCC 11550 / CBS 779.69 / DSM 880 / IAM 14645 / JCM 23072 / IMI 49137) TaxID=857340 RepID=A0A086T1T1_HAPC1|nr:Zinc finger transcription factor-like protein [Hapsidospora chrysogenum ATCC 11550]
MARAASNAAYLSPDSSNANAAAGAPQPETGRDTSNDSDDLPALFLPFSSSSQSDNLAQVAPLPLAPRDHAPMGPLVARVASGPMTRKKMDEEAIAGTVIGAVLGVALLVCCLYPVVVHRLKRHKRANRLSFDCEGGAFRGQPSVIARRLSSSDSLKHGDGPRDDATHGDPSRNSHDAYGNPISAPFPPQGQSTSTPGYVNASLDQDLTIEPAPFHDPGYYCDPLPASLGQPSPAVTVPPHQIVLKGTSEDYYSPYIPSEAFGMYPTPEAGGAAVPKPERTVSRSNSIRYNVKQLFRRKSTRDLTVSTYDSGSHSYGQTVDSSRRLQDGGTMDQFFTHQEATESPIEMTDAAELPFSPRAPGSQADADPTRGGLTAAGSSQPPYPGSVFSHPNQAAQGTVNPMDIMPASTESEMWHRTDCQLHSTSPYESPPHITSSTEHTQMSNEPTLTHPSPQHIQHPSPPPPPALTTPIQPAHAAPPVHASQPARMKEESGRNAGSSSQGDSSSQVRLGPVRPVPLPRRPSNAVHQSEHSTPAPGTASMTTQSTPSTNVDSPSPESLNSSDYCQSASPHAMGVPSPRGGVYCCAEPGCNQVFDQPHKLKHHQRYHSKDHKCPYPTCGKGFGTKTHLQRHINDRHEKKKKFHCSIQGCDYSRAGGKAFPRKDNWKRHMTKIHGIDHSGLPEPVEVDQEMTGV